MNHFISLILFLVLLDMSGCSNAIGPVSSEPDLKDPRTYTWTIDTLFYSPTDQGIGQTIIKDLWGMNDTLVYAVCCDGWGGNGALWKYDGRKWERIKLRINDGGPLTTRDFSLWTIKGFSEKDIYFFGEHEYANATPPPNFTFQACGFHYNGTVWEELTLPIGSTIRSAAGDSPSMIFCGGSNGELYQFDGSTWKVDTIKIPAIMNSPIDVHVAGTTADNGTLIQTTQYDSKNASSYYRLFIYKERQISPIDSSLNTIPWGGSSFWKSKEGNTFSCGKNGVYRLTSMKWTQFQSLSGVYYSINGINENHLFIAGDDKIYFYDGSSWTMLNTGMNIRFINAHMWCSSNGVFVAFNDNTKSYILHGR
jgi:hypothetical protein